MVVFVDSGELLLRVQLGLQHAERAGRVHHQQRHAEPGRELHVLRVIYAANPPASGTTVNLGGNTSVVGGINVDGNGTLVAGSSHVNLIFDDFAFSKVTSYGAAHLVQNKWRHFVPTGP